MPTMQHTWEIMDEQGETVFAIELEVDYTIVAIVPAVISGRPEHCHPEEGGGCDVEAVQARTISDKDTEREMPVITHPAIARAIAHLFAQQHDVEQLCRDHAEAVEQDHQERGR